MSNPYFLEKNKKIIIYMSSANTSSLWSTILYASLSPDIPQSLYNTVAGNKAEPIWGKQPCRWLPNKNV